MQYELVFRGEDWDRVSAHLCGADSERMAFAYGGISAGAGVTRLLVRHVDLCADTDYCFQQRGGVALPAHAAVEKLLRARDEAFLLDIHSHPGCSPFPSPTDEQGAREQLRCLRDLAPDTALARLVVAASGAVWAVVRDEATARWQPVRRIVAPGTERWRQIVPINVPVFAVASPDDLHSRTRALVGDAGASLLAGVRVMVIGCGGTGSAVARMAAGYVGAVTLCDPDVIERHNAPRLHFYADGDAGRSKAEVAAREIARAFPACDVHAIVEAFPSAASVAALKETDFVFCCPDHAPPRYAAAQEAARLVIPLIEVGCGGVRAAGVLSALGSHARLQVPGRPCLVCAGLEIDSLESQESTEAKRRMGYLGDGREIAGELMPLTTRAAADAVELFIRYMTGYAAPVPGQLYYDALRLRTLDLSGAYESRPGCSLCGPGAVMAGAGDRLGPNQRILEPEGDGHAAI